MDFKKTMHVAKLGLAGATALGVTGYGSYQVGKHITSKNIMEQLNNQQIAAEAYNRGFQEGQVEKTAQVIAQELLKQAGFGNVAIGLAKRVGSYATDIGKNMKTVFNPSSSVNKANRLNALKGVAKNPLAIGAASFGAGVAGSNLMNKESSYKATIAKKLLEKSYC